MAQTLDIEASAERAVSLNSKSSDLGSLSGSTEEVSSEISKSSTPGIVPHTIYTFPQRCLILALVSVAAMFSGFASNIYFPAIPTIASDLNVSSELINLTVTVYMIFQGLTPTIWGAISDTAGRRITYMLTLTIFVGACIGLAETRHYYQLVILRCLQSTGSASTIAIGSGVIGDITQRGNRGGWMGFYQGILLAPLALAPVVGGVFAATLGWRAIFWFLAILSGSFLAVLVVALPETLRALVGSGSTPARGLARSLLGSYQRGRYLAQHPPPLHDGPLRVAARKSVDFVGPLRIAFGGDVTCAILFLSFHYTGWQMVVAAMSTLFQQMYHLGEIDTGLTFIANGLGCVVGTIVTGRLLDRDYRRLRERHTAAAAAATGGFSLERARLRLAWAYAALDVAAVLAFGWAVERGAHLAVPLAAVFALGWASTAIVAAVTTLLVDAFDRSAASATAALNLSRCLMGAAGTAAVLPLADAVGPGLAFTALAAVLAASLALLFVQMRYGPRWRLRREGRERERERERENTPT